MSHRTLLHRAVRPLVAGLARLGVSPDGVTGMRLATGLGAAVCLSTGRELPMALGGAVFVISMLLDRVDGALARCTGRYSRFGSRFDLASDCIATMAVFIGLGAGVGAFPGGITVWTGTALGLLAAVSVAVTFFLLNRDGEAAPVARPIDPDDAMLVVPLAVWTGQAGILLGLAAIFAPVAAIVAMLISRSRRGTASCAAGRPHRSAGSP